MPAVGYTESQLVEYIMRQCGSPTWAVELSPGQIQDNIQDALTKYSVWKPCPVWGAIPLNTSQNAYLVGQDVGQGVVDVQFTENRLGVDNLSIGNPFLIAAVMISGLGLNGAGDYDMYLRWRETWTRVTSVKPRWLYDQSRKTLWIHNPIGNYRAAVLVLRNWPATQVLPQFGAEWVKEYALAKCKLLLGETWNKFSGAIPGPGQNLQLDSNRASTAATKITELENKLQGAQDSVPCTTD